MTETLFTLSVLLVIIVALCLDCADCVYERVRSTPYGILPWYQVTALLVAVIRSSTDCYGASVA